MSTAPARARPAAPTRSTRPARRRDGGTIARRRRGAHAPGDYPGPVRGYPGEGGAGPSRSFLYGTRRVGQPRRTGMTRTVEGSASGEASRRAPRRYWSPRRWPAADGTAHSADHASLRVTSTGFADGRSRSTSAACVLGAGERCTRGGPRSAAIRGPGHAAGAGSDGTIRLRGWKRPGRLSAMRPDGATIEASVLPAARRDRHRGDRADRRREDGRPRDAGARDHGPRRSACAELNNATTDWSASCSPPACGRGDRPSSCSAARRAATGDRRAGVLAAHGYPTLALAYFGLPASVPARERPARVLRPRRARPAPCPRGRPGPRRGDRRPAAASSPCCSPPPSRT